jgi:hypothetical protein
MRMDAPCKPLWSKIVTAVAVGVFVYPLLIGPWIYCKFRFHPPESVTTIGDAVFEKPLTELASFLPAPIRPACRTYTYWWARIADR